MRICVAGMLDHMRTTIMLPDELYAEVRNRAVHDGRTITSVIEEALREQLRANAAAVDRPPFRINVIQGRGLQPGVDLDDNAALADLMNQS